MIIDAHQHFWQPLRGDYGWMPEDNPTLNRAYAPKDLLPILTRHNIGGTILVQAAPSVEETEYMLGLADGCDAILGVVGWVDFETPSHRQTLARLSQHPKFLGVRPMIQDIPDVNWMLRADIQWAFESICQLDLSFDALGFPQHLPNFLSLAKRYPEMRTVYDHCMKPQIRDAMAGQDAFTEWAEGITALASISSGYCKFSGLITEAHEGWTKADLKPFSDHILQSFGPDRVMWGSDWPVCRLKGEYDVWLSTAQSLTAHSTPLEQAKVFGQNARNFYRLR